MLRFSGKSNGKRTWMEENGTPIAFSNEVYPPLGDYSLSNGDISHSETFRDCPNRRIRLYRPGKTRPLI